MSVNTFTKTGTKATTAAKLPKAVFGVDVKDHELIKTAYQAYLANGRENLAVTKTRGEIRGGGKKPWRQKGTGRARFGSSRNPIWRKGGIVFGPTGNENFTIKLHLNAKRLALRQALSLAAAENRITVIESFELKDGKTASAVKLLEKIGATRNVLVVVEDKTPELVRATQNIQSALLVQATYLNVFDIMNADTIVVTSKALTMINEWLGGVK